MELRRLITLPQRLRPRKDRRRSYLQSRGFAMIAVSLGMLLIRPQLSVGALIFACLSFYLGLVLLGLSFAPGRPPKLPLLQKLEQPAYIIALFSASLIDPSFTFPIHFANLQIALLLINASGHLINEFTGRG